MERSRPSKKGYKTTPGKSSRPGGQNQSEKRFSGKGKPGTPKPGKSGYPKSVKADSSKPGKAGSFKTGKAGSPKPGKSSDGLVRLNKYIAASGISSRRDADQLIAAGLVTVNGKTITEMGSKVNEDDDVRYNGERIRNERKVYLLLNKPKDYVTTTDDPKERKTVMQLLKNACKERIYPVGRLDRNTTGVLLFTNDGDLAKKLTHPSHNKKKIYQVFLDKSFSAGDMKKLAAGITIEDGFVQPDAISYISSENKREVGIEIHSGKNRIVRRMFEALEYRVTKLDRVYFAGLTKKDLSRGKYRFLSDREISRLKMNAYE